MTSVTCPAIITSSIGLLLNLIVMAVFVSFLKRFPKRTYNILSLIACDIVIAFLSLIMFTTTTNQVQFDLLFGKKLNVVAQYSKLIILASQIVPYLEVNDVDLPKNASKINRFNILNVIANYHSVDKFQVCIMAMHLSYG